MAHLRGGGLGGFTFGTVTNPATIVAVLQNSGTEIQLNIESFDSPKWTGAHSTAWDVNTTQNWQFVNALTPTVFLQGQAVLFDDSAGAGHTSVTLATGVNVTPNSVTFNNNLY